MCGGGGGVDCKKALGGLCPYCKNMGLSRGRGCWAIVSYSLFPNKESLRILFLIICVCNCQLI